MSMMFLYTLSIYSLALAIKIAALFNKKAKQAIEGRKNWRSKLLKFKQEFPHKKIIWFHISSLGEFEQARPLIIRIKTDYPEYAIVITFFSPSGYEKCKHFEYADAVFYLPYDTPKNARDFLNILQPKFSLFVKYEFWLNYLNEIFKRKNEIQCFLISSIFRKHQPFFKWYGSIFRQALKTYDVIFVQDELSIKLLKKIGITNNVVLAGDTRIDRVVEIAQQEVSFPEIEAFSNDSITIIAGSTWEKDEKLLLPVIFDLQRYYSHLRLIIAPHNVEETNIQRLCELLNKQGFNFARYTQRNSLSTNELKTKNVFVIDTIGVLNKIYRYGYLAYIGGGFSDGIHNILEPAVYGLPVVFGPNYHKFYEAEVLIKTKGAFCITNKEDLKKIFFHLIENKDIYLTAQNSIKTFIEHHKGSVERTMSVLKNYISD